MPGEDYINKIEILMYKPCLEKELCVNITIINDTIEEGEESFNIVLEVSFYLLPKILLIPDFARVIIRDVAGKNSEHHVSDVVIVCYFLQVLLSA